MFAYLTDNDSATNTFTIGNVVIDLLEDNYKTATLVCNQTTPKDPKIKVLGESDVNQGEKYSTSNAILFMTVEVPIKTVTPVANDGTKGTAGPTELFTFIKDDGTAIESTGNSYDSNWILIKSEDVTDSNNVTNAKQYVFGYSETREPGKETLTLFDNVKLKNFVENDICGDTQDIEVQAYAIQASNVLDDSGNDLTKTLDKTNLAAIYDIYVKQAQ